MQYMDVLSKLLLHIASLELPSEYGVVVEEKLCSCGQPVLVLAKPNTDGGMVIFHDPIYQCKEDVEDQIQMLTESLLVRLQDEDMFPVDTVQLVPSWHPLRLSWLLTAVSPTGSQVRRALELSQLHVDKIDSSKLQKLKVNTAYPCVLYAHLNSMLTKATTSAAAPS